MTRPVESLLSEARERIRRHGPSEAAALVRRGALLVDIRPAAQRAAHGEIPEALVIERHVLEWRLDPASEWRIEEVSDHTVPVIVVCQEGYASSFAAASLAALGYAHAADLEGGFAAWAAAGLPIQVAEEPSEP